MWDYEMPSVFSETRRKAKKPHRCCECYQEIPKGEEYYFAKGCWDGRWDEFKTCLQCHDQCGDYKDKVGEYPPFGDLRDWCCESDIKFWRNGIESEEMYGNDAE